MTRISRNPKYPMIMRNQSANIHPLIRYIPAPPRINGGADISMKWAKSRNLKWQCNLSPTGQPTQLSARHVARGRSGSKNHIVNSVSVLCRGLGNSGAFHGSRSSHSLESVTFQATSTQLHYPLPHFQASIASTGLPQLCCPLQWRSEVLDSPNNPSNVFKDRL